MTTREGQPAVSVFDAETHDTSTPIEAAVNRRTWALAEINVTLFGLEWFLTVVSGIKRDRWMPLHSSPELERLYFNNVIRGMAEANSSTGQECHMVTVRRPEGWRRE